MFGLQGNGPNACMLSYILTGNWPYYIPHQHPDPILDHKLCKEPGKSLIEKVMHSELIIPKTIVCTAKTEI